MERELWCGHIPVSFRTWVLVFFIKGQFVQCMVSQTVCKDIRALPVYANTLLELAYSNRNILSATRAISIFYARLLASPCGSMVRGITVATIFYHPSHLQFLKSGNAVFRATLLIVALIVTCSLDISMLDGSIHEILRNMQGAFGRVPSFIIGMAIAPLVKCGTKVNVWWLTLLPLIIYVLVHALMGGNMPEAWSLVLPIVVLLTVVLEKVSTTGLAYRFATWMGVISLESYLANIYLPSVVRYTLMPLRTDLPIFTGGYMEYAMIAVLGTLLAWGVSAISKPIVSMLSSNNSHT